MCVEECAADSESFAMAIGLAELQSDWFVQRLCSVFICPYDLSAERRSMQCVLLLAGSKSRCASTSPWKARTNELFQAASNATVPRTRKLHAHSTTQILIFGEDGMCFETMSFFLSGLSLCSRYLCECSGANIQAVVRKSNPDIRPRCHGGEGRECPAVRLCRRYSSR